MNARIDIQTPAGQSLEGFPMTVEREVSMTLRGVIYVINTSPILSHELHKGDKITIEIL